MNALAFALVTGSSASEGHRLYPWGMPGIEHTRLTLELAPSSACPDSHEPRLTDRGMAALATSERPLVDRVRDALTDAELGGHTLDVGALPWGGVRISTVWTLNDACERVRFTSALDHAPRLSPGVRTAREALQEVNLSLQKARISADVRWWHSPGWLCVEVERKDDVRTLLARIGGELARTGGWASWSLALPEFDGFPDQRVLVWNLQPQPGRWTLVDRRSTWIPPVAPPVVAPSWPGPSDRACRRAQRRAGTIWP